MIKAEIIADSLNQHGNRLTTFILEYPRFVHSEFMTHRMFSKNAASSRAIPIEKMIQQIIDNPATPIWWGQNQSGMQANEELDDKQLWMGLGHLVPKGEKFCFTKKEWAQKLWLDARDEAIHFAKKLNETGLHKQITNRILEPWFNIRVICSATEFQNFFALRAHKDAQPEIRVLAEAMLEAYNNSLPKQLEENEWHIPFGDKMDEDKIAKIAKRLTDEDVAKGYDAILSMGPLVNEQVKQKIAIARCARVSYFNFEGKDDYEADVKLCDRLFSSVPRHLSPTEHVAQALNSSEMIGNFRGWKQYRKFFSEENLTDARVK